jgi:hypothetical protein
MMPTPAPTIDLLIPLLSRDVIDAIADRPGETRADRDIRAEGAWRSIEGFAPRDTMEIMMAGHAVAFQSMIMDSVHDSRHAPTEESARLHRQQAVSMSRAQLSWFKEFRLHRAAEADSVQPEAEIRTPVPPPPTPVETLDATPDRDSAQAEAAPAPVATRAAPIAPPGVAPPRERGPTGTPTGAPMPNDPSRHPIPSAAVVASAVPERARLAMTGT